MKRANLCISSHVDSRPALRITALCRLGWLDQRYIIITVSFAAQAILTSLASMPTAFTSMYWVRKTTRKNTSWNVSRLVLYAKTSHTKVSVKFQTRPSDETRPPDDRPPDETRPPDDNDDIKSVPQMAIWGTKTHLGDASGGRNLIWGTDFMLSLASGGRSSGDQILSIIQVPDNVYLYSHLCIGNMSLKKFLKIN